MGEDDVIYEVRLSAARDVEGRAVVKVCAQSVAIGIASITDGLGLSIGRGVTGAVVGECW